MNVRHSSRGEGQEGLESADGIAWLPRARLRAGRGDRLIFGLLIGVVVSLALAAALAFHERGQNFAGRQYQALATERQTAQRRAAAPLRSPARVEPANDAAAGRGVRAEPAPPAPLASPASPAHAAPPFALPSPAEPPPIPGAPPSGATPVAVSDSAPEPAWRDAPATTAATAPETAPVPRVVQPAPESTPPAEPAPAPVFAAAPVPQVAPPEADPAPESADPEVARALADAPPPPRRPAKLAAVEARAPDPAPNSAPAAAPVGGAPAGGRAAVYLDTFPDQKAAAAGLQARAAKYAPLIGGSRVTYSRRSANAWRLRVSNLDPPAAQAMCARIKAAGLECEVGPN